MILQGVTSHKNNNYQKPLLNKRVKEISNHLPREPVTAYNVKKLILLDLIIFISSTEAHRPKESLQRHSLEQIQRTRRRPRRPRARLFGPTPRPRRFSG